MHNQHVGHARYPCHGRETFYRVIGQVGVEGRIDRQRADVTHQQGVAVGRRSRGLVGTHAATSTGDVVNDDRLAPGFGQLLANGPGEDVGAAAGREGHDDAYRFSRIGALRGCLCLCRGQYGGAGRNQQSGDTCFEVHSSFRALWIGLGLPVSSGRSASARPSAAYQLWQRATL